MTKTVVTLNDKYTQSGGQVMLSSLQGVVRLLLDQARVLGGELPLDPAKFAERLNRLVARGLGG